MVNINVQEAKDKITKIFMNVGVNKDEATKLGIETGMEVKIC